MTTLYLVEKKCYSCGTENRNPVIDFSQKISGPRDLDGRPANVQRSLVYLWIQRCEKCNYCAPDISKENNDDIKFINLPEYKAILDEKSFPLTAASFRAHSLIREKQEHYADAGWAQLCAAWVCDDNKAIPEATLCRKAALSLFRRSQELGQSFLQTRAEENVCIIDIMRRTGQFEDALALCDAELTKDQPDPIWEALEYEKYLIEINDTSCHNETDAEDHCY